MHKRQRHIDLDHSTELIHKCMHTTLPTPLRERHIDLDQTGPHGGSIQCGEDP